MTTTIEIKVPDVGDFTDIPVIEVLVSAGDHVNAEDSLITLESDKATMEVPAPQAGVIREVRLKVDDKVSQGDVVAILEVTEDSSSGKPAQESADAQPPSETASPAADDAGESGADAAEPASADQAGQSKPVPAPPSTPLSAPPQPDSEDRSPVTAAPPQVIARGVAAVDPATVPYASPSVRQFARELGADLGQVKGSGTGGRILREDVTGFIKAAMSRPPQGQAGTGGVAMPPAPKIDFSKFGKIAEEPLSRIRKLSAAHLHRSWISIPHVTQHDEADITNMEEFRKANAADAEKRGFKLTPLVFLIKASVAALREFPQFNASLDVDGETLILKSYYNIGIAVDTPQGLVVPVLRECDRKGIMDLARELGEISARARDQKLKLPDIQGGCFSISSLGGIGGTAFTPIINAPEVAIMGVSRSRMQPVWDGKAFQPRLMLPLSVSYDHRVVDGAAAARFTRFLASQLEDLRRLTL